MDSFVSYLLLAVGIIVIGMLLIWAYVITPIIDWLIFNPIAGFVLLIIFCVLIVVLIYTIFRD